MYFVHKYLILYNQFERTYTEDVVMTPLHIKFFHNNRPGKPLPGHSSFLGLFWALFFVGGDGWREGRTDCRRGGCMVVPGAVVSPGHTKRLSLLPCRAPHNSPCTLMRTWLRQMGLTLRLVAAEYLPVRSPRRQV